MNALKSPRKKKSLKQELFKLIQTVAGCIKTAREYQLLCYMAENANKKINKERLYEQVWGERGIGYDNTVMVHIRHIREKIENDPANPEIIITVKGLGYKFINKDG